MPNEGFALLAAGQFADCKNLGFGVPSLMAADEPCPLLQPSLLVSYYVSKEAKRYTYVAAMQEGEKIWGASIVMWWA